MCSTGASHPGPCGTAASISRQTGDRRRSQIDQALWGLFVPRELRPVRKPNCATARPTIMMITAGVRMPGRARPPTALINAPSYDLRRAPARRRRRLTTMLWLQPRNATASEATVAAAPCRCCRYMLMAPHSSCNSRRISRPVVCLRNNSTSWNDTRRHGVYLVAVWQLQCKVVQAVQQHVSNQLSWIHRTCDYIQLNVACCLVVGLGLKGLKLGFLVSGW